MIIMKESPGEKTLRALNAFILILCGVVSLYPLLYVISASFSNPLLIMKNEIYIWPKGFTLIGYQKVFENQDVWIGFLNTIFYTVLGTIINVVMTGMGGYVLARKEFYGRTFWTMVITFTMFFGGGMIPAYILMQKLHMYNTIWVMLIPGAISSWNLIIMRTFIQTNIPNELYESAIIDGANDIKILTRIVVPLSAPIIAVMSLFYGVDHWNEYFRALIYIQDRKLYPLQLILREILIQQQVSKEMMQNDSLANTEVIGHSIRYALIVVATVPILVFYPFLQKYFVKGMLIGAIKG